MMLRLSAPAAAVLAALRTGHTYGLAIMRHTGLKSGTVYPVLRRMEQAGWIEGRLRDARPPRRTYQITEKAPAAADVVVKTRPEGPR